MESTKETRQSLIISKDIVYYKYYCCWLLDACLLAYRAKQVTGLKILFGDSAMGNSQFQMAGRKLSESESWQRRKQTAVE